MNRYKNGVLFLVISIFIGCINDVITKFIGIKIPPIEIIFFRFLGGFLFCIFYLLIRHKNVYMKDKTCCAINALRGVLGAISFYLCAYSVINIQLIAVTAILWSIPLFTIIFSKIFLNEDVSIQRCILTSIGFVGILMTMCANITDISINSLYFIPLVAALLFSLQDIMMKKLTTYKEDEFVMILHFSFFASICTIVPTLYYWIQPSFIDVTLMLSVGFLGGMMQYFIFLAYRSADLSALTPVRYSEFIFQGIAGFVFFGEIPEKNILLGVLVIVPTTFFIIKEEIQRSSVIIDKQKI